MLKNLKSWIVKGFWLIHATTERLNKCVREVQNDFWKGFVFNKTIEKNSFLYLRGREEAQMKRLRDRHYTNPHHPLRQEADIPVVHDKLSNFYTVKRKKILNIKSTAPDQTAGEGATWCGEGIWQPLDSSICAIFFIMNYQRLIIFLYFLFYWLNCNFCISACPGWISARRKPVGRTRLVFAWSRERFHQEVLIVERL